MPSILDCSLGDLWLSNFGNGWGWGGGGGGGGRLSWQLGINQSIILIAAQTGKQIYPVTTGTSRMSVLLTTARQKFQTLILRKANISSNY